MKDEYFNELIASIQEAGKIHRGEEFASRTFEVAESNVKETRQGIASKASAQNPENTSASRNP